MNEGPRTVVANPRLTSFDVLFLYEELSIALQRVEAATRSHHIERERLHGQTTSVHQVLTAWRTSNEVLEAAVASFRQAHDAILAQARPVSRALRAQEEEN